MWCGPLSRPSPDAKLCHWVQYGAKSISKHNTREEAEQAAAELLENRDKLTEVIKKAFPEEQIPDPIPADQIFVVSDYDEYLK